MAPNPVACPARCQGRCPPRATRARRHPQGVRTRGSCRHAPPARRRVVRARGDLAVLPRGLGRATSPRRRLARQRARAPGRARRTGAERQRLRPRRGAQQRPGHRASRPDGGPADQLALGRASRGRWSSAGRRRRTSPARTPGRLASTRAHRAAVDGAGLVTAAWVANSKVLDRVPRRVGARRPQRRRRPRRSTRHESGAQLYDLDRLQRLRPRGTWTADPEANRVVRRAAPVPAAPSGRQPDAIDGVPSDASGQDLAVSTGTGRRSPTRSGRGGPRGREHHAQRSRSRPTATRSSIPAARSARSRSPDGASGSAARRPVAADRPRAAALPPRRAGLAPPTTRRGVALARDDAGGGYGLASSSARAGRARTSTRRSSAAWAS